MFSQPGYILEKNLLESCDSFKCSVILPSACGVFIFNVSNRQSITFLYFVLFINCCKYFNVMLRRVDCHPATSCCNASDYIQFIGFINFECREELQYTCGTMDFKCD